MYDQRPVWGGAAVMFPDGTIWKYQIVNPVTRIEVIQHLDRATDFRWSTRPLRGEIELSVSLSGLAVPWDVDRSYLPAVPAIASPPPLPIE